MTTFIAIYRGQTIGEAKIIAVSADPELVEYVADCLIDADAHRGRSGDPVMDAFESGKRRAIQEIAREARGDDNPLFAADGR